MIMKNLLKKLVKLFLALILFLLPSLSMQAMSLTDQLGNEVFDINDARYRRGETITVKIDKELTHPDEKKMPSFCGRPCPLEIWCSFLVRNFLSGYYTRTITRVEFKSEAPHSFESSSIGLFDGGDVYLKDNETTAVIACKSIADVNVTQLRYHAMFIFKIPVDSVG